MTTPFIPTLAALALLPALALPTTLNRGRIHVTNHSDQPVDVVMMGAAVRYDLGMVGRNETGVFTIPTDLVGMHNVRVLADPIDNLTGFKSTPITVLAGHDMHLVVASHASRSHLTLS